MNEFSSPEIPTSAAERIQNLSETTWPPATPDYRWVEAHSEVNKLFPQRIRIDRLAVVGAILMYPPIDWIKDFSQTEISETQIDAQSKEADIFHEDKGIKRATERSEYYYRLLAANPYMSEEVKKTITIPRSRYGQIGDARSGL